MIGTSKVKRQEQEIIQLRQEVFARDETIEILQTKIQTIQADHSREQTVMQTRHVAEKTDLTKRHKKEVSLLKTALSKAVKWFPYFREMIRMENVCHKIGFDDEQTATLIKDNRSNTAANSTRRTRLQIHGQTSNGANNSRPHRQTKTTTKYR